MLRGLGFNLTSAELETIHSATQLDKLDFDEFMKIVAQQDAPKSYENHLWIGSILNSLALDKDYT